MKSIKKFKNKKEIFNYIIKTFKKNAKAILIHSSTTKGRIKNYSDFDFEVYGITRKPYYELGFIKK